MVADHRQSLSTWALAAGLVPSHLSARGRSLVPLGPAPGTASVALSGGNVPSPPACPPARRAVGCGAGLRRAEDVCLLRLGTQQWFVLLECLANKSALADQPRSGGT
jgi:hypothetical protein